MGMRVDPDNIHIMIAEDHTNRFKVDLTRNSGLEFNGKEMPAVITDLIAGSRLTENGELVDAHGAKIDPARIRITGAIEPQDIEMTDDIEDERVLVDGTISDLVYKGDHYSYVINTELGQDFIVDDEYLWNMDDHVGLILPPEKMKFTVRK